MDVRYRKNRDVEIWDKWIFRNKRSSPYESGYLSHCESDFDFDTIDVPVYLVVYTLLVVSFTNDTTTPFYLRLILLLDPSVDVLVLSLM